MSAGILLSCLAGVMLGIRANTFSDVLYYMAAMVLGQIGVGLSIKGF